MVNIHSSHQKISLNIKKWLILVLAIMPTLAFSAEKNLAYNDSYIWQLAWRLSTFYGMRHGFAQLPPDMKSQLTFETALEYHRQMISCNGPLKEIEPHLPYAPLENTMEYGFHLVGAFDANVWPIIISWSLPLDQQLSEKLRTRVITTAYPECITPGYVIPVVSTH